jgi:hypothetical protein
LHLARRLLSGSFGLRFRIAGHLAEGLLDGPLNPMGRSFNTILVHIRSPKLPMVNTQLSLSVSSGEQEPDSCILALGHRLFPNSLNHLFAMACPHRNGRI